ncbi:MAG: DUF1015 domain-containing protein [Ekhidna sp.]|nr:DUF1015 domain-containing protein [Ekhidna sp.]
MAEIKPLRAWRYNKDLQKDLGSLVSPLFDVVSEKQRRYLYENEYNSIHISVPDNENTSLAVSRKVIEWKSRGILRQDALPSIYVYYQYFTLPGSSKEFIRKGFIANLKVYDWDENVVFRHESTMPFSVENRIDVLDKTQMNASPTHGLFADSSSEIEFHLDKAIEYPLCETDDYQGVRDVFGVIQDAKIINRIIEIIKDKQIILADGHHRYEASLRYKKKKEKENPDHNGTEGYNYHLMYFTNTESDDLKILPTHRLLSGLEGFSEQHLLNKIEKYFFIQATDEATNINEVILSKEWAFGLLVGENAYEIRLKPELIDTISWNFPQYIKRIDLTVLHYFIIEKCVGILGESQKGSKKISFERNFAKCLQKVTSGESQCAIITKDIAIDTIKKVCYSGYTLPQKSTYFYPKVICGFLFSSIKDDEFNSSFDEAFK